MDAPKTGDPIEFRYVATLTREQLRAYGEAARDPNPIHLDDEVARKAGLPGVIAHGMLTAAFIAERGRDYLKEALGAEKWRIAATGMRFRAMTFPGDEISVGGAVKNADDSSVTVELKARNQKDEVTTTGWVRFERR